MNIIFQSIIEHFGKIHHTECATQVPVILPVLFSSGDNVVAVSFRSTGTAVTLLTAAEYVTSVVFKSVVSVVKFRSSEVVPVISISGAKDVTLALNFGEVVTVVLK